MSVSTNIPRRGPRACDACKRRKVRCDSQPRCLQCVRHDLPCVYSSGPSSRSRLGAVERGTLITQYRIAIDQDSPIFLPQASSIIASSSGPTFEHLEPETLYSLLPHYVKHVYPVCPVMGDVEIRNHIQNMNANHETAMLVYAFTSIVTVSNRVPATEEDIDRQVDNMVSLALGHYEPMKVSPPTITRLVALIFLEVVFAILDSVSMSFFYLREAITLVQMLQQHIPLTSETLDPPERARRQRIYWLCFVHERWLALVSSTTICLDPLPSLPDVNTATPHEVEQGWNCIIKNSLVVDREFVSCWTGDRSRVTADWIQRKHNDLADDAWQLEVGRLSMTQQADLIVTRQWLRTLTWQMAISNFLTSSNKPSSEALSLAMPVQLSSELRCFLEHISSGAGELYRGGFTNKLFEITNTIADVLLHLPLVESEQITSRRIDLFNRSGPYTKEFWRESSANLNDSTGIIFKSSMSKSTHGRRKVLSYSREPTSRILVLSMACPSFKPTEIGGRTSH